MCVYSEEYPSPWIDFSSRCIFLKRLPWKSPPPPREAAARLVSREPMGGRSAAASRILLIILQSWQCNDGVMFAIFLTRSTDGLERVSGSYFSAICIFSFCSHSCVFECVVFFPNRKLPHPGFKYPKVGPMHLHLTRGQLDTGSMCFLIYAVLFIPETCKPA